MNSLEAKLESASIGEFLELEIEVYFWQSIDMRYEFTASCPFFDNFLCMLDIF